MKMFDSTCEEVAKTPPSNTPINQVKEEVSFAWQSRFSHGTLETGTPPVHTTSPEWWHEPEGEYPGLSSRTCEPLWAVDGRGDRGAPQSA